MVALIAVPIIVGVRSWYQYSNQIDSYWSLADKASTISQKATYIDKFAEALKSSGLEGQHNAVFFTTPDNSFDRNFEALESLRSRLHEIEGMDVTSFQYQTAIQQITQQEQGEAAAMLSVFQGCWYKEHYFIFWSWMLAITVVSIIILEVVAGIAVGVIVNA